jgi:hypothetical protein
VVSKSKKNAVFSTDLGQSRGGTRGMRGRKEDKTKAEGGGGWREEDERAWLFYPVFLGEEIANSSLQGGEL